MRTLGELLGRAEELPLLRESHPRSPEGSPLRSPAPGSGATPLARALRPCPARDGAGALERVDAAYVSLARATRFASPRTRRGDRGGSRRAGARVLVLPVDAEEMRGDGLEHGDGAERAVHVAPIRPLRETARHEQRFVRGLDAGLAEHARAASRAEERLDDASSAPVRTRSVAACRRARGRALDRRIDFPAPVSPVMTFRPGSKRSSSSSMMREDRDAQVAQHASCISALRPSPSFERSTS